MKLKAIMNILVAIIFLCCVAGCEANDIFMHAFRTGSNIRTMIEIRNVAIAIECYKVDHGMYPQAQSIQELQKVARKYLAQSEALGYDKWSQYLLVDSNHDGYLVSSKGDDKVGTHEYGGGVDFPGHSITMQNGVFVQYYSFVEDTARKYEAEIEASREK